VAALVHLSKTEIAAMNRRMSAAVEARIAVMAHSGTTMPGEVVTEAPAKGLPAARETTTVMAMSVVLAESASAMSEPVMLMASPMMASAHAEAMSMPAMMP